MNILWHSNAPHAPTGYGNQTALFTPLIQKAGHKIAISAFYGREGAPAKNEHGILELPRYRDTYGNDVIEAHFHFTRSEALVSLIDPFILDTDVWGALPWWAWVPVDSAPISPENLQAIQYAKGVWSMSKFGHEQLKAAGLDPMYVPHGIDTQIYKPVDRIEARNKLGSLIKRDIGKDTFLVVTVAANKGAPSRKNFAGMLEAFAMFAKNHPDSLFYMHTEPTGRYGGDDIFQMSKAYGVADKVAFPPEYNLMMGFLPPPFVNDVYNAGDVFMLLSYGEGFGIPIVEAQAAGCPVIVTDGSTGPELCFSGWTVAAIPVQAMQGRFGCRWWMALPPEGAKALEAAYSKRMDQGLREKARAKALDYDYKKVFQTYMQPALDKLFVTITKSQEKLAPVVVEARKPPPKVSVIMPCFNGQSTIDKAVESVLSQEAVDFELLIIDDGSDDGTWKYLRKFRDDPRITVIDNRPGGGPVGAINKGLSLARGRYICKLDVDDWYEAGALAAMVKTLDENPKVGFVYGGIQYHGDLTRLKIPDNGAWQPGDWKEKYAPGEEMYRRVAYDKGLRHRGFWTDGNGRWFGPHDRDFVMQMIFKLGWQGKPVQQCLLNHHFNEAGIHTKTAVHNGEVEKKFYEYWPHSEGYRR